MPPRPNVSILAGTSRRRCQARVNGDVSWLYDNQCSREAKVGEYCRQHDPVAKAKRAEIRYTKNEAEWQTRRMELHGKNFYKALQQIAAGYTEPQALARAIVDKFEGSK